MSYTITITQTKEETKHEASAYCEVSREYLTEGQIPSEVGVENPKDWKFDKENNQYSRPIYGYPPKREITKEVTAKIFEATVDLLDVNAVIRAMLDTQTKEKV